jgi:hypothetical protein
MEEQQSDPDCSTGLRPFSDGNYPVCIFSRKQRPTYYTVRPIKKSALTIQAANSYIKATRSVTGILNTVLNWTVDDTEQTNFRES